MVFAPRSSPCLSPLSCGVCGMGMKSHPSTDAFEIYKRPSPILQQVRRLPSRCCSCFNIRKSTNANPGESLQVFKQPAKSSIACLLTRHKFHVGQSHRWWLIILLHLLLPMYSSLSQEAPLAPHGIWRLVLDGLTPRMVQHLDDIKSLRHIAIEHAAD